MTLSSAAYEAWRAWGGFAHFTFCADCERFIYCRADKRRGPWLCLDCWDLR